MVDAFGAARLIGVLQDVLSMTLPHSLSGNHLSNITPSAPGSNVACDMHAASTGL